MLELTRSLESAVEEGIFPGAVALVGQGGRILCHDARGCAAVVPRPRPLTRDTLFDIASLTKPVASTTAAMLLSEAGDLKLSDKVSRFLPEFAQRGKDDVTLRHLLAHASGLPAWLPLYQIVAAPDPGGQPSAEAFPAQRVFRHLHAMGLEYPPGTRSVYSDLGFIVLGEVIERVAGMPLDRFAAERVFGPLGMASTFFNRGNGASAFPPEAFAATELSLQHGCVLCGEVHDENAYFMGGVAGHAGVFSTAHDLATFVQTLLDALAGESGFLSSTTVARFVTRADLVPGSSWGLGWDTPSVRSSSGTRFSPRSFGHTGFTGTSIWVDPERRLYVVLLTNRVHPSRDNTRIAQFRPRFHDLVMSQVLGG